MTKSKWPKLLKSAVLGGLILSATSVAMAAGAPFEVELGFTKMGWSPAPTVPQLTWDGGFLRVDAKWPTTYTDKDDVRYDAWIESATIDWASANMLKSQAGGAEVWRQKLYLSAQSTGALAQVSFKMTFGYRQPGLSSAPIVAQDGSTSYVALPSTAPLAPGSYTFSCVITRTTGGNTETARKDFNVTIDGKAEPIFFSGISDSQVYQRNTGKTGQIAFWMGSTDGAKKVVDVTVKKPGAADINKQLEVTQNDQQLVLPDIPVGGPYTIELKCNDVTRTFSDILVGDIWIIGGQSNAVGAGSDATLGRKAVPGVNGLSPRYGIYEWQPASDGFFENTVGAWVTAAQDFYKNTGVPVGLIGYAVGSKKMDYFMDGAHNEMPFLKPIVEQYGRHARMFFWYQGESDSFAQENWDSYGDKLKKMALAIRRDTGTPNLPIGIVQLSKYLWFKDDHFAPVREAQRQFVLQDSNSVLFSTAPYEVNGKDKIHLVSKSYVALGEQIAQQMTEAEQTGRLITPGPTLKSVGFSSPDHKEITATFTNGGGLAGGSDINEWYVTDASHGGFKSGGFVPISGVKIDPQSGKVTLALSEPAGPSAALSYAYRCDLMGTLRNDKNYPAPAFVKVGIETQ